jgi:hypothetical protein
MWPLTNAGPRSGHRDFVSQLATDLSTRTGAEFSRAMRYPRDGAQGNAKR